MNRRVLVLNHYAAPLGAPGGTRHIELFGRLDAWDAVILAGDKSIATGTTFDDPGSLIRTVRVAPHGAGPIARLAAWCSYFVTATVAGLRGPVPDVVYASSPHLFAGLAGWVIARLRRRPFVLEVRDLWPQVLLDMGQLTERSPIYRLLRALELFLYRRASAVVAMARGSQQTIADVIGEPARVQFIPNGADPEDFVVAEPREALRERFGMRGICFLYAGAHGPANDLDALLDAAAVIQRERTDVEVVLVGGGIEKDRLVERARLERLDNVRFLDPVPKRQIPALLAAADVGVHVLADVPLFRYGVSPNKLFDYMAAGLPVLTNTAGEVAGLVRDARAGVVVAPDDLVTGLRMMAAASQAERSSWGDAGRRYMLDVQSRKKLAGDLERLLNAVADGDESVIR